MRTVLIVYFFFLLPLHALAEELMTTAEAERQAIIDAAKQQAEQLKQVMALLENRIGDAERRSVPAGKRAGESTSGKIVNGVSTGAYPTAGALIMGTDAGNASSHCTGTLIGPRTFLTAAHCVDGDPDPNVYHVFLQHGGVFGVNALTMHPDYNFPHADLAVLTLDTVVTGITPTPLNDAVVPLGSQGEIVGYGRAGGFNFDYGIKRAGTVQTAECSPFRPPSLLCWNFDDPVGAAGLDSNTCNADSGGPLYLRRSTDTPLILAGVTSGGSQSDCLGGDHSYDVDVVQFNTWITDTADGDLAATADGSLPVWGSDQVTTLRAEVEFTNALRSRTYTLTMPDNVQVLRVAMNGHDATGRNFDLFVKEGSSISAADNDCAQNGDGQYAFCEFTDPSPGTWTILLETASGDGLAQVSATLFED